MAPADGAAESAAAGGAAETTTVAYPAIAWERDPLDDARRHGLLPDKNVLVLCLLSADNPLRRMCSRIVISPAFNNLVLILILSNSVLMAVTFWRPEVAALHGSAACPIEAAFTSLFAVEMLIKVIALGVVGHSRAYLTSTWNVVDGIIVVGSLAQLGLGCDASGGSISILRSLRVLRPLRSMARVRGMRIILRSLFAALPALTDNTILIAFLILIFAVLGVQLFRGDLHRRCYAISLEGTGYEDSPEYNYSTPLLLEAIDTRCGGSVSCTDSDLSPLRPGQVECAVHLDAFEHGPLSWDNTGLAVLLVFKLFTGDDWPEDMFMLQNASGAHVWVFFFMTFMVGVLFATNLFLAVLIDQYLQAKLRGEWIVGARVVHEARGTGTVRSVDDTLLIHYDSGEVKSYPLDTPKVRELTDEELAAAAQDQPLGSPSTSPMQQQLRSDRASRGDPGRAAAASAAILDLAAAADCEQEREMEMVEKSQPAASAGRRSSPLVPDEPPPEARGVLRSTGCLVQHPHFDTVILGVTFINVLALAVDHHNIDTTFADVLAVINLVCTVIFACEILLKVLTLGVRNTFRDGFNCLDAILVAISVPDLVSASSSKFTAFRALKALKIVGKWPSLYRLVRVVIGSLSEGGYISLLMLLEIFIFSILGMQLFEGRMPPEERRHFDTLWEAALSCFVIISGDAWAAVMKEGMSASSDLACIYFLLLFLIGNFVIVNVFTAVILGGLGDLGEESDAGDGGAFEHSLTLVRQSTDSSFGVELVNGLTKDGAVVICSAVAAGGAADRAGLSAGTILVSIARKPPASAEAAMGTLADTPTVEVPLVVRAPDPSEPPPIQLVMETDWASEGAAAEEAEPWAAREPTGPCEVEHKGASPCRRRWQGFVTSRPFDAFVVLCLILNTAFLALENSRASQTLRNTLDTGDLVFTLVFGVEMLLKMGAYGVWGSRDSPGYLRDHWNKLDCFVVLTSVAGLFYDQLSVLRSLRTLRLMVRVNSMRVLVMALLNSLPAVSQGIVLCAFLFLVFAIFGVQLFKGVFYACTDEDVYTEAACWGPYNVSQPAVLGPAQSSVRQRQWARFNDNFDHLWASLQVLTIVAIGEGWSNIMYSAMDTTGVGSGPRRNATPEAAVFFVLFHVIGSFFALNLIIGILIDSFIQEREHIVSAGLSELPWRQRQRIAEYLNAERAMRRMVLCWKPQCPEAPQVRRWLFRAVHHPLCDWFITICILLNGAVFATVHYGQEQGLSDTQEILNYVFTMIFIAEAVFKLLALGPMYFRFNWNRFDFAIVLISVLALAVPEVRGVSAVRVLRLARLFRLVAKAKGLQKLFNVIFQLDNILYFGSVGVLLAAVFFVFACIGQSLFGKLKRPVGGIDHNMNLETVPNAMLTLFTISTTEGWLDVRDGLTNTDDCGTAEDGEYGQCGSPYAVVYLYLFMICGYVICLNAFSAVVCELHGDQNEEELYAAALRTLSRVRDRWQAIFGPRRSVPCAALVEALYAHAVPEPSDAAEEVLIETSVDALPLLPPELRCDADHVAQRRARKAVMVFNTGDGFPRRRATSAVSLGADDENSGCDSSDGEQDRVPQVEQSVRVPGQPTTVDVLRFLRSVRIRIHSLHRQGAGRSVVHFRDLAFALSRKMFGSTTRRGHPPLAGLRPGDMDMMRALRLARPNTPHDPLPHEVTLLHWFVAQRLSVLWVARQQSRAQTRRRSLQQMLPVAISDGGKRVSTGGACGGRAPGQLPPQPPQPPPEPAVEDDSGEQGSAQRRSQTPSTAEEIPLPEHPPISPRTGTGARRRRTPPDNEHPERWAGS
eukprot:TRINITY_DN249_c1_g1_i1.p1 TRINITY_DN249_c1_g1~~TRINITY_DN249_c1_g1_i1.p1  ORF type:complete len:1844 (+),score=646.81 TRINITY_DN249_c1_g1_i1:119-5533(+)